MKNYPKIDQEEIENVVSVGFSVQFYIILGIYIYSEEESLDFYCLECYFLLYQSNFPFNSDILRSLIYPILYVQIYFLQWNHIPFTSLLHTIRHAFYFVDLGVLSCTSSLYYCTLTKYLLQLYVSNLQTKVTDSNKL